MNGELRRGRMNDINKIRNIRKTQMFVVPEVDNNDEENLVHESCNCSGFTMMAVGASLLSFVGIIIYAIVV